MTVFGDTQARDVLVNTIEDMWLASDFKDVSLFKDNGPEPQLDHLERFVKYEIYFMGSEQMTLGENPIDRTRGFVRFFFGTRQGKGTRALLVMRDYVKQELKAKNLGAVKTLIPSPEKSNTGNGWHFEVLTVPFYFDGMPIAYSVSP